MKGGKTARKKTMNRNKLLCGLAVLSIALFCFGGGVLGGLKNRIEIRADRVCAIDMRGQGTNDWIETVVVIDRAGNVHQIGKHLRVSAVDNGGHRIEE